MSIERAGIDPKWPSRKTLLRWLEACPEWPLTSFVDYNARNDPVNVRNLPPSCYGRIAHRMGFKAEILALQGRPWEAAMVDTLGYATFQFQLEYFWHGKFRQLFVDHPQPLRMMNWEAMTASMAMAFALGQIDEGLYLGDLVHATLNRGFQLQLSYEEKHRCGLAFMLRLFADWRGGVVHAWPPYASSEPLYEGLLETWRTQDPDALVPWLLAACDRHTHQARPDTTMRFFDFSNQMRTPLEILLLFRLRESSGLKNPQLDHPLMEAPYDRLPDRQPPYSPDAHVLGTLARLRVDWPEYDGVVAASAVSGWARAPSNATRPVTDEPAAPSRDGAKATSSSDMARRVMQAGSVDLGWEVMRAHPEAFFWTDDEEPVVRWNEFARATGETRILDMSQEEDRPELRLAERACQVPLVFDRDDAFILIHAIARIGADVLELRFCRASAHSSDQAYLACPPAAWTQLEQDLGAAQVGAHYMPIPPDVREFARQLYAPHPAPPWAR